jgi:hypothetical protein
VNVHTVYPVLMNALNDGRLAIVWWRGVEPETDVRRSKDGSIPVAHHHILSISKSV